MFPVGIPRNWQISAVRSGWALPEKIFRLLSVISALMSCRPARPRLRPRAGAGGFEPPVLDPKSSVLPLDDAPTGRSAGRNPLGRRFVARREARGPSLLRLPGIRVRATTSLRPPGGAAKGDRLPVAGQDLVFDFFPRLVVQRMGDVAERAVLPLLARHRNEQPVGAANDLDVADDKAVIDDDGNEGLELLLVDRKHPDVGDLHAQRPSIRRVSLVRSGPSVYGTRPDRAARN